MLTRIFGFGPYAYVVGASPRLKINDSSLTSIPTSKHNDDSKAVHQGDCLWLG